MASSTDDVRRQFVVQSSLCFLGCNKISPVFSVITSIRTSKVQIYFPYFGLLLPFFSGAAVSPAVTFPPAAKESPSYGPKMGDPDVRLNAERFQCPCSQHHHQGSLLPPFSSLGVSVPFLTCLIFTLGTLPLLQLRAFTKFSHSFDRTSRSCQSCHFPFFAV